MRKLRTITIIMLACLALIAVSQPMYAQQNTVLQTSLSAAITNTQTSFGIASATGVNAPTNTTPGSLLYVQDLGSGQGEVMQVTAISSTTVTVKRGAVGGLNQKATSHASGAMVLVATSPGWFQTSDPVGACSTTAGSISGDRLGPYVTPVLNMVTGRQWICSAKTGTWVAGWGNYLASPQALSSTATASVAGATAIAGPFVEISGTNAITQFNMSAGWNGQGFCAYPTGGWSVTATNNIAKAATAVADRVLCFVYDANSAKFSPQY